MGSVVAGLLERERELARLDAALDGAADGSGSVVVIEGHPGIGKTRLVNECKRLAKDRGYGRLQATGYESERALAWGVVRQLVERTVVRFDAEARRRILEGPAGRALQALDVAPSAAAADEDALAPTLHALWWVAVDLAAERPQLITVDDLDRADLPSRRFVAYLARRISDLSIVLVVATGAATGDDRSIKEILAVGDRLRLEPLSRDAVAGLVAERGVAGAEEVIDAVHRAADGNPFLTGQLLDELEALGRSLGDPATAAAVERVGSASIAERLLARLGTDALALAKAVAVAGRGETALAIELSGLDGELDRTALQDLEAADVLAADGSFAHAVVRETILQTMGPGERSTQHARVARKLAERGDPPEGVAPHLIAAPIGTLPDAAERLRRAAAALVSAGDLPGATSFLRRALDERPGAPELEAELGAVLLRGGEAAEARLRLLAAAEATTDPLLRASRHASAAAATLALEGPARAAADLRELIAASADADARDAALLLEAHHAGICAFDPEEFRRCRDDLERFAGLRGETHDERALLAVLARRAVADVRPARECAALARRALGDGAWVQEGPAGFAAFGGALVALVMADDVGAAQRNLDAARATLDDGAPRDFILLTACQTMLSWRNGDVDATVADAGAAIDALALTDRDPAVAGMHAVATRYLVLALIEGGRLDEAEAALGAFDAAAVDDGLTIPRQYVRVARAALALARSDPRRALAEARALGEVARSLGAGTPAVPWRSLGALAASRLGDHPAARDLAFEQLELARAWGAPTDVGAALRVLAHVEAEERAARLAEAVAVLERAPSRLELAHALADLGAAQRVERKRTEARESLRRAADVAEDCGARALLTVVHEGLEALGDRPRKLMFSGLDSLTGSERRVAELAAGGHSNREIAQTLFVTPKTVENHLGRIYMKLGVGGRRELPDALTVA